MVTVTKNEMHYLASLRCILAKFGIPTSNNIEDMHRNGRTVQLLYVKMYNYGNLYKMHWLYTCTSVIFACGALAASISVGIVIPSSWLSIYITNC